MLSGKALSATSAPLPIEYVGGYATSVTASTSDVTITFGGNLTGGLAASASEGDTVVVYFGVGSSATDRNLVIAGYTELADLFGDDVNDSNLAVGWKRMGVTPDTTVTLTGGTFSVGGGGSIAIQVWRNVDSLFPVGSSVLTATSSNSVLCNPPSITPTINGSVIIAGGVGAHTRGVQTFSSADLTNFISSGSTDVSIDSTIGVGYKEWLSGAFDPAAFTFSGADSVDFSWAAVTFALRPIYRSVKPTFVASAATQNTVNSTSLVINKPTGTQQGDLMIAFMAGESAGTWTGDTGWTEVVDANVKFALRAAYKVAGASEGASYTFTSSSSRILSGAILTYRGAAYDAIGSIASGANPLVITGPTASEDFSVLIGYAGRLASGVTITAPASMTARVTDNDGNAPSYVIADEYVLAGATGTRSFTIGSAVDVSGVLLTIKPA